MRLGYRPALDGIRGIAIAAVVLVHAFNRPGGGILGVDLFFVLSGFLITTLLLEERDASGTVSIARFYARRAFRLVPALAALLVVYVIVTGNVGEAALGGLYVSNVVKAWGLATIPFAIAHLWSLAAEEQFYLVWPALLLVVARGRRPLALGVVLGLLALSALDQGMLAGHATTDRIWFGPDTRADGILVGCLCALLPARIRHLPRPIVLAGALVTAFLLAFGGASTVVVIPIFAVAGGVVVLEAARTGSTLERLLRIQPLAYLGRISYSLYLWHVPALIAVGAVTANGAPTTVARGLLGVAVAVAAACCSYYLVERPARRYGRTLLSRRAAARAAVAPAAL
jgi:peptidoglycan/LPS O-acetylase OafA/YrhL